MSTHDANASDTPLEQNLSFDLAPGTGNDPAAGDAPTPEDPRELLVSFALAKLDELIAIVADCDDGTVAEDPGFPGGNSLGAILHHTCAMMRWWTRDVILDGSLERDRDAEFAPMPVADLVELARETSEAFESDAQRIVLDAAPAARAEGSDEPLPFWTTTNRGILLHVFEEISQHLGQAQITRDLLAARKG